MSQGEGRIVVQRRITKNGNSFTISLPWPFLHALHLEPRHLVVLELDDEHQRFSVIPFIDVTDVDRTRWQLEGATVATRKMLRFGNSLSFAIPRGFMHAMYVFSGDALLVRRHEERRMLTVSPLTKRAIGPHAPRCEPGVAHYGK